MGIAYGKLTVAGFLLFHDNLASQILRSIMHSASAVPLACSSLVLGGIKNLGIVPLWEWSIFRMIFSATSVSDGEGQGDEKVVILHSTCVSATLEKRV